MSVAAIQAQTTYDPAVSIVNGVRYGSTNISGTARYRSMAGAFGALGGDPSCMNDNPAGLAIYRGTSLFNFTPNLTMANTNSHGSTSVKGDKSNGSMSNMSAIFSFRTPDSDHLVNFTMGIGFERKYQKQSTYTTSLDYSGSSLGNYLRNQANDYLDTDGDGYGDIYADKAFDMDNSFNSQAAFLSHMAWDCRAIVCSSGNYKSVIDPIFDTSYSEDRLQGDDEADAFQRMTVRETTRLDYYTISGALNFNDMFYVGASINISDFNSVMETNFDEYYSPEFRKSYIKYDNWYETKGSGIGLNLGLLWMPIDNWRIGAAIHTPTWSDLEEIYDGSMTTDNTVNFRGNEQLWSTWGESWKYCFDTPWEYQLSTAYIIGTRGLISVEYDLRDYASMNYKPSDSYTLVNNYFGDINEASKEFLQAQHTIKVGGEYRLNRQWSLRAGFAHVTSPYTKSAKSGYVSYDEVKWNNYQNKDYTPMQKLLYYSGTKPNYQTEGNQNYVTCGAGWRGKQWYVDAAFMYHKTDMTAFAYPNDFISPNLTFEPVDVDLTEKNFDLTIGYKF